MRGNWNLTQEEKEKYAPYIKDCIKRLNEGLNDGVENISLNDTSLNPENVSDIMRELGYEDVGWDTCGWEYDFWIYFNNLGQNRRIVVSGTGATFDLNIHLEN